MARDTEAQCRKCRRAMEKLFLKGDRCNGPKCGMIKRAYIPGVHGKKMSRGNRSEYGIQLAAKQKIKRIYGVLEKQFRKHFSDVKGKKGVTGDLLLIRLETRLDNVVFRLGYADSRAEARLLVTHGHFMVNGRRIDVPSANVEVGDTVAVRDGSRKRNYFKNLSDVAETRTAPSWLSRDLKGLSGSVLRKPERSEIDANLNEQLIVEYYSR